MVSITSDSCDLPFDEHRSLRHSVVVDLDVLRIADVDMRATFTHEIRDISDMRRVVHTTRHLLMQTVARHHYNMLLSEGYVLIVAHVYCVQC